MINTGQGNLSVSQGLLGRVGGRSSVNLEDGNSSACFGGAPRVGKEHERPPEAERASPGSRVTAKCASVSLTESRG